MWCVFYGGNFENFEFGKDGFDFGYEGWVFVG